MTEKDGTPREHACPICGRPAASGIGPFCSKRCADIDLGRWLKDIYRVPTNEAPAGEEDGRNDAT